MGGDWRPVGAKHNRGENVKGRKKKVPFRERNRDNMETIVKYYVTISTIRKYRTKFDKSETAEDYNETSTNCGCNGETITRL